MIKFGQCTLAIAIVLYALKLHYSDDDHRISLVPLPNIPECQNNYINASYIDV